MSHTPCRSFQTDSALTVGEFNALICTKQKGQAMEIETLYFLTQIVAAIAMIASLIFVGFQLRQNTEQVRIASVQTYYDIMRDHLDPAVNNPEFMEIFLKGFVDLDKLTVIERSRLYAYYSQTTKGYQVLHFQHGKKVLENELWESAQNHLADMLVSEAYLEFWKTRKHHYNIKFQEFVDDLIETRPAQNIFTI